MIEGGIRSLMIGESTISDVIGNRVFVGYVDRDIDLPYATIEPLSRDFLLALDGTSNQNTTFATIDVNCWGATFNEAKSVADVVRVHLDDYTGGAGANDKIEAVLLNDETYAYASPTDGSSTGRHLVNLEFTFQYIPL